MRLVFVVVEFARQLIHLIYTPFQLLSPMEFSCGVTVNAHKLFSERSTQAL
jgi:hypothetical protein